MLLLLVAAALLSVINGSRGAPAATTSKYNQIPLPPLRIGDRIYIEGTMKPYCKSLSFTFYNLNDVNTDDSEMIIDLSQNIKSEKGNLIENDKFKMELIIKDGQVVPFSPMSAKSFEPLTDTEPKALKYLSIQGDIDRVEYLKFEFQDSLWPRNTNE